MTVAKRLPAWFQHLDLREALLCWLSSAQSRFETAAITAFRSRWSVKAIRLELRALQHDRHITLAEFDRVRWAIHVSGRVLARRARSRAEAELVRAAVAA